MTLRAVPTMLSCSQQDGTRLTPHDARMHLEEHLIAAGRADSTAYLYATYWQRFHMWARSAGHDPTVPTAKAVRQWSHTLPTGVSSRDNAKAAVNWWCDLHGLPDVSGAVDRPEGNSRSVGRQLSRPEARDLLSAANDAGQDGDAIYLGLFAGLRISELTLFRYEYIDTSAKRIRYRRKKNKQRTWHEVRCHPILLERLGPQAQVGGWLFPGANEGHLSVETVRLRIRGIVKAAGLPVDAEDPRKVTSHALRRTAGREAYERAHYDITVPQQLLGHSTSKVTERYIGATVERTAPAIDAMRYDDGGEAGQPAAA